MAQFFQQNIKLDFESCVVIGYSWNNGSDHLPQNYLVEMMNCPKSPLLEGRRQKAFLHKAKRKKRWLLSSQKILESVVQFLDAISDMEICRSYNASTHDQIILEFFPPLKLLLKWFCTRKVAVFSILLCLFHFTRDDMSIRYVNSWADLPFTHFG